MKVLLTGASGLVGPAVIAELSKRGAEIAVLTRDPARTRRALGGEIQAFAWKPEREVAPTAALAGVDAVVHLAGEPIAQRWTSRARARIRDSRLTGTRNLVAGLAAVAEAERPRSLISSSAIGIYGARHEEPLDEDSAAGYGFLAETCVAWEAEAQRAAGLGLRVACTRTGMVLSPSGGALAKMLPPFRMGLGGPVAGGDQFVSWIHIDDLAAMIATATEDERWSGPINATAPEPVTNRELSRALGQTLGRPAALPVPAIALQLLYGQMAEIVTTGQRVLPARALVLGYRFAHPHLQEALESALS